MTGAFPAAIIGLGAGGIGGIGEAVAGFMDIGIGESAAGFIMDIGIGEAVAGFIMTIDAGDPESITLDVFCTRVSSPTPTSALSTGRGDGETFGPLL